MEKETIKLVKKMVEDGNLSQEIAEKYCPELKESEDWIPKEIIKYLKEKGDFRSCWIAWLEKQGEFKNIDSDDLATLETWEDAVKENKEKWQLSDWFVKATSLLIQKIKRIENNESINIKDSRVMLNACINALRNVGHSHLSDWLEKQGEKPLFKKGDTVIWKGEKYNILDVTDNAYNIGGYIVPIHRQNEFIINQKPADKVELKFKVGDWVVYDMSDGRVSPPIQVAELTNKSYIFDNGESFYFEDAEDAYRKWAIQDGKDGDVLASELCGSIILFKGIENNNIQFYCDYDFSGIDVLGDKFSINNGQHYGSVEDSEDFHPATKEQRDLLFQKMKEAGYEWDTEKKELKKIENPRPMLSDFFKAEYERGKADTLKCIRWSEEDEEMCQETIDWFEKKCFPYALENDNPAKESIKWLKSLKEKYTWKPNEEQLKSLQEVIDVGHFTSYPNALETLYEQLKQL